MTSQTSSRQTFDVMKARREHATQKLRTQRHDVDVERQKLSLSVWVASDETEGQGPPPPGDPEKFFHVPPPVSFHQRQVFVLRVKFSKLSSLPEVAKDAECVICAGFLCSLNYRHVAFHFEIDARITQNPLLQHSPVFSVPVSQSPTDKSTPITEFFELFGCCVHMDGDRDENH